MSACKLQQLAHTLSRIDQHLKIRHFTERYLSESRRDQEEGGELDSHEEVRLPFAGPGEIKKREVVLDP